MALLNVYLFMEGYWPAGSFQQNPFKNASHSHIYQIYWTHEILKTLIFKYQIKNSYLKSTYLFFIKQWLFNKLVKK